MKSMDKFLYRIRPADALLDKYQELEKQQIYFASPDELNDPVEDYKDFFWSGDEIVWRNFLKHYLLSLKLSFDITVLQGVDVPVNSSTLPLVHSEDDLPAPARAKFLEVSALFFSQEEIAKFPQLLASRINAVRRNELMFHLMCVQRFALSAIFSIERNYGLLEWVNQDFVDTIISNKDANFPPIVTSINQLEAEHPDLTDGTEKLFTLSAEMIQQVQLLNKYNNKGFADRIGIVTIVTDYPRIYLRQIDRLAYGRWFAACFMENCTNPSVWSHYGDAHKGICLKFRTATIQNRPAIKLNGIVGVHGGRGRTEPTYGERDYIFHPVNYAKGYPAIDFSPIAWAIAWASFIGLVLGRAGQKECVSDGCLRR
jgi:hypothetical protein